MVWYVLGINFALHKTASQSHTYLDSINYTASKAVDGNLNTRTATTYEYSREYYWWKVDIGKQIIFTYAAIYVRTDACK